MMSPGLHWYVVHTQPEAEARAELNLRRQGYCTYLPRYVRSRRHARRTDVVTRPLFPRYMFVALDLAKDRWLAIQSTFGVHRLVLAGERPAAISAGVIEEIRAREDAQGLVRLRLPPGLGPGSPVRLTDGIFAEYNGIIERIAGERRVAVLLKLLGRDVRVFVPAGVVRAT